MKLELNNYGQIAGWRCDCDSYNDALTEQCWNCGKGSIISIAIQSRIRLIRAGEILMDDKDRLELHAKYFAAGYALAVQDQFDITKCAEKIKELEEMAAGNRSGAMGINKRKKELEELNAKNHKFYSEPKEPKAERKPRQTKAQRVLADLAGIMSSEDADALTANLNLKKPEPIKQALSELCRIDRHSECPGSFNMNGEKHICTCKCGHAAPQQKIEVKPEPSKPFDPTSLFK